MTAVVTGTVQAPLGRNNHVTARARHYGRRSGRERQQSTPRCVRDLRWPTASIAADALPPRIRLLWIERAFEARACSGRLDSPTPLVRAWRRGRGVDHLQRRCVRTPYLLFQQPDAIVQGGGDGLSGRSCPHDDLHPLSAVHDERTERQLALRVIAGSNVGEFRGVNRPVAIDHHPPWSPRIGRRVHDVAFDPVVLQPPVGRRWHDAPRRLEAREDAHHGLADG